MLLLKSKRTIASFEETRSDIRQSAEVDSGINRPGNHVNEVSEETNKY